VAPLKPCQFYDISSKYDLTTEQSGKLVTEGMFVDPSCRLVGRLAEMSAQTQTVCVKEPSFDSLLNGFGLGIPSAARFLYGN